MRVSYSFLVTAGITVLGSLAAGALVTIVFRDHRLPLHQPSVVGTASIEDEPSDICQHRQLACEYSRFTTECLKSRSQDRP